MQAPALSLKAKGDLAELEVATDLLNRGCKIAFPYCCYYVAAAELGAGVNTLHLRLTESRNGQTAGIRMAADYLAI